jgi:hypothetical protein
MSEYRTMGEGRSTARMTMRVVIALGLLSGVTHAMAQPQTQTPLTSQTEDVQVTRQNQQAMPVPQQAPGQQQTQTQIRSAPVPQSPQIGDATASLLALQREGRAAAPAQPMLGAQASAAYARYLKSFDHAIPEQSSTAVGTVNNSSSNTGTGG